jgi:hypothetical protein
MAQTLKSWIIVTYALPSCAVSCQQRRKGSLFCLRCHKVLFFSIGEFLLIKAGLFQRHLSVVLWLLQLDCYAKSSPLQNLPLTMLVTSNWLLIAGLLHACLQH